MKVKIEISARHVHLAAADCKKLFGTDELTVLKDLSQAGEFASNETVEVTGPKGSIEKVRVIGPLRDHTQLEISLTDCRLLGTEAPIKVSGDLPGEEIRIKGPRGEISGKYAIVANRHLHLSSSEARDNGFKDGDLAALTIQGIRRAIYGNVVIRVDDKFSAAVHLDTDEGNAAGLTAGLYGEVEKESKNIN